MLSVPDGQKSKEAAKKKNIIFVPYSTPANLATLRTVFEFQASLQIKNKMEMCVPHQNE